MLPGKFLYQGPFGLSFNYGQKGSLMILAYYCIYLPVSGSWTFFYYVWPLVYGYPVLDMTSAVPFATTFPFLLTVVYAEMEIKGTSFFLVLPDMLIDTLPKNVAFISWIQVWKKKHLTLIIFLLTINGLFSHFLSVLILVSKFLICFLRSGKNNSSVFYILNSSFDFM